MVSKLTQNIEKETGGYDDGYKSCPCFWGRNPGSLILRLISIVSLKGTRVLDAGCGEGKNAAFVSEQGAEVDAVELSEHAIANGKVAFGQINSINWHTCDIRKWHRATNTYDIVIAYGLLHCLPDEQIIRGLVAELRRQTVPGGYHVICAFNSRSQNLVAHPDFHPTLLPHSLYLEMYGNDSILYESDDDLTETHPHNGIEHTHSMTRILVKLNKDG